MPIHFAPRCAIHRSIVKKNITDIIFIDIPNDLILERINKVHTMNNKPTAYVESSRNNVKVHRVFFYIAVVALFIFPYFRDVMNSADTSYFYHLIVRALNVNRSLTTFKTPSLLPCDAECLRFGRLLHAWPKNKPKAAVIFLLKPSIILPFARSVRLFDANFNNAHNYPLIVFHERNSSSKSYRQRLRSLTKSSLYFQV